MTTVRVSAREGQIEWFKRANQFFQIRFDEELPDGVTLSAPTADAEVLTKGSEPEDWNAATGLTPDQVTVVDAVADDGTTVLGANQAIQFRLPADTDPQPDPDDDPKPGETYRVYVEALRSDSLGDAAANIPLLIHF